MVDGPRSPLYISPKRSSISESKISGADDPSAISVRLATVGFHTLALNLRILPSLDWVVTVDSCEVISSMADMNTSAANATPTNVHSRNTR